MVFSVRFGSIVALVSAAILTVASPRVQADTVTFEYTGVVNSASFSEWGGTPMIGTFEVDIDAGTFHSNTANSKEYRFSVVTATIQLGPYTIVSKPLADFDTSGSIGGANANYVRVFNNGSFNTVIISTFAGTAPDGWYIGDLTLTFTDRDSGAIEFPNMPTDLSGFNFGLNKDYVALSMGGSPDGLKFSTWISGNGSLRILEGSGELEDAAVVPSPSVALGGVALLGVVGVIRRRGGVR